MIATIEECPDARVSWIVLVAETVQEAAALVRLGMNTRKSRSGHDTYATKSGRVEFNMMMPIKRNASGLVPHKP